eukprot:gene4586-5027_t
MAEIQQLQKQLAQRDTLIEGMKLKFKEYATKLKSRHQEEIESLRKADCEEKIVALERKLASTEEVVKQQTDQLAEMRRLLQSKHEELSACQQHCASSLSENSPFESLAMESLQSELFSLQAAKEKLKSQLSTLQISFNQKDDELQLSNDFDEKIVALERKVVSAEETANQQADQLAEMQRLLQSKQEELTSCQQRGAEVESSLSQLQMMLLDSQKDVAQRDVMIESMKVKFKEYAVYLMCRHQEEVESLRQALSNDFDEKIVALERKVVSAEETANQQADQLAEMQRLLQSKQEELTSCQQRGAEVESSLSQLQMMLLDSQKDFELGCELNCGM